MSERERERVRVRERERERERPGSERDGRVKGRREMDSDFLSKFY